MFSEGLTVSAADGHCWTVAGKSLGTSSCSNPVGKHVDFIEYLTNASDVLILYWKSKDSKINQQPENNLGVFNYQSTVLLGTPTLDEVLKQSLSEPVG